MTVLDGLRVDHVGLAVSDLGTSTDRWVECFGMRVHDRSTVHSPDGTIRRATLRLRDIWFVLTEAGGTSHPAAAYVAEHGDGVYDIALRTPDVAEAFRETVARGAVPVSGPAVRDGIVTATVAGFGDTVHTLVQRESTGDGPRSGLRNGLRTVDHFAVCVEAGRLASTVEFYRTVLDFEVIFTEHIVVGSQAMDSTVVRSRGGDVVFTVLEPDQTAVPGQIDQFLKDHNGAGVQHIAFATDDIVRDVRTLGGAGVDFLVAPAAYYDLLADRITPVRHSVDELRDVNVLVDEDETGQLLQIFTASTHPRGTLFFELIERLGARTFGSGNIRALYTSVELQRSRQEAAQGD